MKIGTDFSGIGAPEMALKYLGIDFESVFACEIDKYARKSFEQLHAPKTFYNDITTRNHSKVDQLDLYVAGFPCQSFSMAGKRKGFEETRGTLFFNVAEFIKENQPKTFVLENVKGLLSHDKGRTFQTIIDILSNGGGTQNGQISLDVMDDGLGYHIYWKVLNTKNFGIPQNRERIFIVGFKDFRDFTFPKEMPLELKLKDILEDEVDEKYYLSEKMTKFVTSTNFKEAKPVSLEGIAPCQKVGGDITCFEVVSHSLYPRSSKTGKGGTGHLSKQDGTSYFLDTGNAQAVEIQPVQIGNSEKFGGPVIIGKSDSSFCLRAAKNGAGVSLGKDIRRLTPLECWRLQGFRDEDFHSVKDLSDTQLYKQAGNSITVDVLMHLFQKIYG
jgi:DNA (cytosine-5)-methyltransferase 1